MTTIVYILLILQMLLIIGVGLFLRKKYKEYRIFKIIVEESIRLMILDNVELENKVNRFLSTPRNDIDLPDIFLS